MASSPESLSAGEFSKLVILRQVYTYLLTLHANDGARAEPSVEKPRVSKEAKLSDAPSSSNASTPRRQLSRIDVAAGKDRQQSDQELSSRSQELRAFLWPEARFVGVSPRSLGNDDSDLTATASAPDILNAGSEARKASKPRAIWREWLRFRREEK